MAEQLTIGKRIRGLFSGPPPLPEDIPTDKKDLVKYIVAHERAGVDVREAWRLLEKAEKEPNKASIFIARACSNLALGNSVKRASTSVFSLGIVFIVVLVISVALLGLFKESVSYIELIFVAPLIVIIWFLRDLTVWIRRLEAQKPKPLEDIVAGKFEIDSESIDLGPLLKTIFDCEKEGVNVKKAWELYRKARAALVEDDGEKAKALIERAYGDLHRKAVLLSASSGALSVSFIALGIAIILFVLLVAFEDFIETHKILTVPLFIIGWGLIGSISYVLISAYRKIKEKTFEWYDLPAYFYRFLLGGVLAGIAFYLVQLGVTSLPGAAGEEASAAVAEADAIREFRDDYFEREKMKVTKAECLRLKEGFGSFPEDAAPERLAGFLIDNADLLKKYSPPEVLPWEVITRSKVEDGLSEYVEKVGETDEARDVVVEHISEIKVYIQGQGEKKIGKKRSEYEVLLSELDKKDDVKAQGEYLETKVEYWKGAKLKREGEEVGLAVILGGALTDYTTKLGETEKVGKKLTVMFEKAKSAALPELEESKEKAEADLELQEEAVERWRHIVESVDLMEEFENVSSDVEALEIDIMALGKIIQESLAIGEDVEDHEETLKEKKYELVQKRLEMEALEEKLQAALARDLGNPVWQAPIFIVLAFLSGYSVEFVTRLLEKAQDLISGETRESEEEREMEIIEEVITKPQPGGEGVLPGKKGITKKPPPKEKAPPEEAGELEKPEEKGEENDEPGTAVG
jgi:hypothetical protein